MFFPGRNGDDSDNQPQPNPQTKNQPSPALKTGEIQTRPTLARLTEEGIKIENLMLDSSIEDKENLSEALSHVEGAWLTKVENIGHLVKQWEYDIDTLKAEIDRLQKMAKAMENRKSWLEEYCKWNMIEREETEFKFPLVSVLIKANPPSVEVFDESLVPEGFLRLIPAKYEVNKIRILEMYRAGDIEAEGKGCLLYTSPSPRDRS